MRRWVGGCQPRLQRFQALPRPRPRPRPAGGAACAGATGCCCLSHSLSSHFCSALSVLPSPPTTRTKPFSRGVIVATLGSGCDGGCSFA
eukprot:1868417-Prymnesium_polylepis.1